MHEPDWEAWGMIRRLIDRGSSGFSPTSYESRVIQEVVDYVICLEEANGNLLSELRALKAKEEGSNA
jgi:hypothetical protein